MTIKPRILVCSESSRIASGFGVYNHNLLNGIFETNKYSVAEFACYGLIGDKEKYNIPWKYYPNAVLPGDPRSKIYTSSPDNHFGKWRFERVVADFKPHVVIDIRDYWMSAYQKNSPFRRLFHWILMPTIDSSPQQEEWLDTYINADGIFTYSDWGKEILQKQTSNNIKFIDVASPCADTNLFCPVSSRQQIKPILRLDPNYTVIGTVMRNQKRKLFPELINTFEKTIDQLKEIGSAKANTTILYLHTSYPDAGWDMSNLVKNSKYGNKIFFTYACRNCGAVFASNLSGYTQKCYRCDNKSAVIPNVSNPISTDILGKIIGIFDIYVQYSICEGFGMPQIEAASCGVPVVTVDYSAMSDLVNKVNAYPISVGTYFKELETSAIRVYPDHNSLMSILIDLIEKPENIRNKIGFSMRQKVLDEYQWSKTISKWISYLDTVDYNKYEHLWNSPPQQVPLIDINSVPKTNNVYEAIYLLQKYYLDKMNLSMSDFWLLKQIQAAQNGFFPEGPELKPFSITDLINNLNKLISNYNESEKARMDPDILTKEDYIDYANRK